MLREATSLLLFSERGTDGAERGGVGRCQKHLVDPPHQPYYQTHLHHFDNFQSDWTSWVVNIIQGRLKKTQKYCIVLHQFAFYSKIKFFQSVLGNGCQSPYIVPPYFTTSVRSESTTTPYCFLFFTIGAILIIHLLSHSLSCCSPKTLFNSSWSFLTSTIMTLCRLSSYLWIFLIKVDF